MSLWTYRAYLSHSFIIYAFHPETAKKSSKFPVLPAHTPPWKTKYVNAGWNFDQIFWVRMAFVSKCRWNEASTHSGNGFIAFLNLFSLKNDILFIEIDEILRQKWMNLWLTGKKTTVGSIQCQSQVVYCMLKTADVNIGPVGLTTKNAMCSIYY